MEWSSFDDEKVAAAVADEYIARNRDMFPWVEEKCQTSRPSGMEASA